MAGIAYSRIVGEFPVFLDNTFRLVAMVTLPLALLSIGGTLTLKNLKTHLWHAFLGSTIKLLVLPIIGWFFLEAFDAAAPLFSGGHAFFRPADLPGHHRALFPTQQRH